MGSELNLIFRMGNNVKAYITLLKKIDIRFCNIYRLYITQKNTL